MDLLLVPFGVASILEPLSAHATRVRPLSRVRHEVPLQLVLLREKATAVGTDVRLRVARVQLPVPRHHRWVAEGLATFGALVGFFLRVCPQVDVQAASLVEALLTDLAGKGSLASVSPLVPCDAPPFVARVGAVGTSVLSPWPLSVFPCPMPV